MGGAIAIATEEEDEDRPIMEAQSVLLRASQSGEQAAEMSTSSGLFNSADYEALLASIRVPLPLSGPITNAGTQWSKVLIS